LNQPIRVFIADEQQLCREGLRTILSLHPEFAVVGESGTIEEALVKMDLQPWDVSIVCLHISQDRGFEMIRALHAKHPDRPILGMGRFPEVEVAQRAVKTGATGYLSKGASGDEFLRAMRAVAAGKRFPALESPGPDAVHRSGSSPHELLSDRELQVLGRLASGLSVTAIAEVMGASVKTVSTYRSRILQKTGLTSTGQLIRYALDHELHN
jgi:DNA-binding NarL/FixJ family response regulator